MFKNLYIRVFLLTTGLFGTGAITFLVAPRFVGAQSATSTPGYIYLSQVPYTGFGDVMKLAGFFVIVALWSLLVVMVVKNDKVKEIMRRMFRNVDHPELQTETVGAGYVFDLSSNQVLSMNMSPVRDITESFVPKQGYADNSSKSNGNGNGAIAMPTESHSGNDLVQEVNSFMTLVVRGDEQAVFDQLRKLKGRGVDSADFASRVVLELDSVYRSKVEGENNKTNMALSQTLSAWNRGKIESVIASLLTIVDHSYNDSTVGTKVAIMRIMRAV